MKTKTKIRNQCSRALFIKGWDEWRSGRENITKLVVDLWWRAGGYDDDCLIVIDGAHASKVYQAVLESHGVPKSFIVTRVSSSWPTVIREHMIENYVEFRADELDEYKVHDLEDKIVLNRPAMREAYARRAWELLYEGQRSLIDSTCATQELPRTGVDVARHCLESQVSAILGSLTNLEQRARREA